MNNNLRNIKIDNENNMISLNLNKLENNIKQQDQVINELKRTLANKIQTEARFNSIEKQINELRQKIENNESENLNHLNENNNQRNHYVSEDNIEIKHSIQNDHMKNPSLISNISSNFDKKHQLIGYINNINENANLNGDGLESVSKQIDEIKINNNIRQNYENQSQDNNISKYDNKENNSIKYQKNNEYSTVQLIDKDNLDNFLDKKYLKKFLKVEKIEVNIENKFHNNKIDDNNRNSNIINTNDDYENHENYIRQRKSTEKDDDDIMIEEIIKGAKNERNNDDNYIEKPNNVNGNDFEKDDFDDDEFE